MRPLKFLQTLTLLVLAIVSCSNLCLAQTSQGITGEVVWKEGNHMPTIGSKPSGISRKVSREVVVYRLIKNDEVKGEGPLYDEVNAKKVAVVRSGKNGKYRVRLAPGKYSVFVKEKGKLFANGFDGGGYINPVEVKKGAFSKLDIVIDYQAAY